MADSSQVPGYDRTKAMRGAPSRSGLGTGGDMVTSQVGQYPPTAPDDNRIFGGALPTTTGAPGSGGGSAPPDPTNLAGQETDDFTGLSHGDVNDTNAPGSSGADIANGAGSDSVVFTRPGSYLSGSYASDTVRGNIDGPASWTEANADGYATGGPKLPGMKEPTPDNGPYQPSSGGRVLRGGRSVRG